MAYTSPFKHFVLDGMRNRDKSGKTVFGTIYTNCQSL